MASKTFLFTSFSPYANTFLVSLLIMREQSATIRGLRVEKAEDSRM